MKINKVLYIVIFCLSLSSCSKWLTIEPADQVSEKDLYSTAEGYHNQVNGIYRTMAQKSLYGREMTWGYVDALAQYYEKEKVQFSHMLVYRDAASYKFETVGSIALIQPIWQETYNAIANCNDLIAHTVNADTSMFFYRNMERNLILGEAYALRAMLHFDILRLFAPAPVKNSSGTFIPYVKDFPTHIPMKLTNSEILKNILEDLDKAEKLTANFDTTYFDKVKDVRNRLEYVGTISDRFVEFRGYRLNYYAIKALIARVCMYAGGEENKAKALRYAEELIKLDWFRQTSSSEFTTGGDKKLYKDVIFALYNNKLVDVYKEVNRTDLEFMALLDYEGIFGEDGQMGKDQNGKDYDYREYRAKQWDYVAEKKLHRSVKINPLDADVTKKTVCNKMIPMIRIGEMYYIAAECLYATNKTQAVKYLETIRTNRGVKKTTISDPGSQAEFNKLILNEMRREMYGEGQLFFFYKRLNLPVIIKGDNKQDLTDKEFVLPIPMSNDIH